MHEEERLKNLEERLNDVESLLDKICTNSNVCSQKGERTQGTETMGEKIKKYLD